MIRFRFVDPPDAASFKLTLGAGDITIACAGVGISWLINRFKAYRELHPKTSE